MRSLACLLLLALSSTPSGVAQPRSDRPSDSLLARPFLQSVVDLQVARDGAVLTKLLDNEQAVVRARAAFALASVQDTTAIPALLDLLDDPDPRVRADAAFALGQMPGGVPPEALFDALAATPGRAPQRRLIEALGKKGDAASLVRLVGLDLPDALHESVTLAVGRYALRDVHASRAVAYLYENLKHDDPTRRLHAAYYFGRTRDPEAWSLFADSIRTLLDDLMPEDPAAIHLVQGLGRMNDPADTQRLLYWLKNGEDWRIRVHAVRALASRTDESGIRAALYDQLVDPYEHVAVAAAEALNDGKTWSETDLGLIKQWVYYNSYAWRITAPLLTGLAQQDETEFVLDQLDRRRAAPPLLAYQAALPALKYLPHRVAFDRLVNAVHHQDERVSYAALTTLADRWQSRLRDPGHTDAYFETFVYALGRKDVALTYAASDVLTDSTFQALGAGAALMQAYENLQASVDPEQMTILLNALGKIDDAAVDSLLRRELTHPDPAIIRTAGRVLETRTGEAPVLPGGPEPPDRTIDWASLQRLGPNPHLVLETEKGAITLVLNAEEAPLTTQTVAQFAQGGTYDGVPFHRVVPNFVVQGGDFTRRDGWGGPPFKIRSEFTRLPYEQGMLGMANSGKDTEGSQFFITHSLQPHLDGRYTAFGYVLEGQDVVDRVYPFDRVLKATLIPQAQ